MVPDLTVVGDDRVVAVRDGTAGVPVGAIVGMDDRTIVAVEDGSLTWRDSVGGVVTARVELTDDVVPLVTDLDGRYVALGPPDGEPAEGTIVIGRAETTLEVRSPSGDGHRVTLPGNFVPEAFSTEPSGGQAPSVFLVEYLPADAPTHYRVRVLDWATGELRWPSNLRDKVQAVDTEMAGISRDQVVAADRGLLFTLYRGHHAGEGEDYAFVHVLGMTGGVWCLEVPAALGLGAAPGAVAVSPDERTLYVASANGALAEYDIDAVLDPQRDPSATRVTSGLPAGDARPALTVAEHGPVLAQAGAVAWVDARSLEVFAEHALGSSISALAGGDGDRVVAATADGVVVVEPGASPVRRSRCHGTSGG